MSKLRDTGEIDILVLTGDEIFKGVLDKHSYLEKLGWWNDDIVLKWEDNKEFVIPKFYKLNNKTIPDNDIIIKLDMRNIKPEKSYLIRLSNMKDCGELYMDIGMFEAAIIISQADGYVEEITKEQATNAEINLEMIRQNSDLFKLEDSELEYIINNITENYYEYYQRLCSELR